ncbi:MAG: HAD family hydrolase [Saccharolobus sp.]
MSFRNIIFNNIKAVLFDFDDTLVDFKSKSQEALISVSRDIYNFIKENYNKEIDMNIIEKIVITESERLDKEGEYNRNKWWESVLKALNIDYIDKSQLYDWTRLYWSIASNTEPYDDAEKLIDYLYGKGYKLGIVTNSDGEGGNKNKRLKNFPLINKFNVIIIAGEQGIRPKPNLEPFLIVCERLSVEPVSCLFVGDDRVKDCLAAKKANMKSVLVDREGKVKDAELYADFVVSKLTQLEEFL